MTARFGAITSSSDASPFTRQRDLDAALTVNTGPYAPIAAANPTSQNIYGLAHYLYSGETVTNIAVCVQTAASGAAPSNIKLGLWDSGTPTCLAVTSDLASDSRWTSQGWKVCALTSPYAITSDGVYYLAFWINGAFGGTNVSLVYVTASGPWGTAVGAGKRRAGTLKTGATSMAASDTGTYGQAGNVPLMGWS